MRVIDADELIEHVWRDRLDSRERIANLVESMPTVRETEGVWQELVRCRDCKYFNHLYRFKRNACGCPQGCVKPEPDGYCSYGERKK